MEEDDKEVDEMIDYLVDAPAAVDTGNIILPVRDITEPQALDTDIFSPPGMGEN